jgi:lipopolysaccharide export LptBFGC system permease protein LptF
MKLWQKHLFKKLLQFYFFLLFTLFGLYAIVDFSVNGAGFFKRGSFTLVEITLYYLQHFSKHIELFLPLTFLLATLKVLLDLNLSRELVALQMAGLSQKKLLLPFFAFAAFLSGVCYFNSQFFSPHAQEEIAHFQEAHSDPKKKPKEKISVAPLKGGTEVVYQKREGENSLFDVFWVQTPDEIWHMRTLTMHPQQGHFVEHLVRNSSGQFEKKESYAVRDFPEIEWDTETDLQKYTPLENRPISLLLHQAKQQTAERKSVLAHLHYKLALPLLPFLILFAITPFTMSYRRNKPIFLFVASSLFCFVALCTLLDALLILAENQALPAHLAIWTPLLSISLLTFRPFFKSL